MAGNAQKDERAIEAIKEAAGAFVARETNGKSLITVTNVSIADRGSVATILISVYPEERAEEALTFLKRNRGELREHIRKSVSLGRLPHIDVELDSGEKNRQHIDVLLGE